MNTGIAMDISGQPLNGISLPPCPQLKMEPQPLIAEVRAALADGNLELPVLPSMARKFQELTDNPDIAESRVVELLATDPVVSMYIIGAANSAALSNGNRVCSLRDAVIRLGYRMLRCMVVNITMSKLFQARSPLINRQLMKFWRHSREVAAACHVLAQQHRHLKPEEAMLAGLVHDIGVLPLYLHADRSRVRFDQTTLEALAGEFSASIGTELLQSWNFPDELVAVAAGHEDPCRVNASGVADYVDVVTMANLLMSGAAQSVAWRNIFGAERLGYYAADCRNFLSNHAEQLAAAKNMLGISATLHEHPADIRLPGAGR